MSKLYELVTIVVNRACCELCALRCIGASAIKSDFMYDMEHRGTLYRNVYVGNLFFFGVNQ